MIGVLCMWERDCVCLCFCSGANPRPLTHFDADGWWTHHGLTSTLRAVLIYIENIQMQLEFKWRNNLDSKQFIWVLLDLQFRFRTGITLRTVHSYIQSIYFLNSEFLFSLDPLDSESRFRVVLSDLQFRCFLDPEFILRFELVTNFQIQNSDSVWIVWIQKSDSEWLCYTYCTNKDCTDLKCFTWVLCRFSIRIQSGSLIFSTSMQVCIIGSAMSSISTLSVKQSD